MHFLIGSFLVGGCVITGTMLMSSESLSLSLFTMTVLAEQMLFNWPTSRSV